MKTILKILKDAFERFNEKNAFKMSASLSYYSLLSIGPLIFLVVYITGLVLGDEAASGQIFNDLEGIIGADSAETLQDIVKNTALNRGSWWQLSLGLLMLLFTSSTLFVDMDDSINSLWDMRPQTNEPGWKSLLRVRLRATAVILSLSFLLVVSLLLSGIISMTSDFITQYIGAGGYTFLQLLNYLLSMGIMTIVFFVIFRLLPKRDTPKHVIWKGAATTTLLFLIGKFGIEIYLSYSDIGGAFGGSRTLILLLVWLYYSAAIFYFGACITRMIAYHYNPDTFYKDKKQEEKIAEAIAEITQ